MALEREIKLRFDSADEARVRVQAMGATPLRCRRLQEDSLLDTPDGYLRNRRAALRVRHECGHSLLTFKGPPQAGPMKLREEHETPVGVFVEIEGGEEDIGRTASALGRSASDYITDSYRTLFEAHREQCGAKDEDMVFPDPTEA